MFQLEFYWTPDVVAHSNGTSNAQQRTKAEKLIAYTSLAAYFLLDLQGLLLIQSMGRVQCFAGHLARVQGMGVN
jgi:hypothetical protein